MGRSAQRIPPDNGGTDPDDGIKRFQMRVSARPSVHSAFLKLCMSERQYPNQVLGRWIERAVKRGQLGK